MQVEPNGKFQMQTKVMVKKRVKKRVKKSGVIYFAINSRIKDMVKIGMTVDSAEARLTTANRKNEFMPGRWAINQKVKTNDVKRTEDLSHQLFKDYHDKDSISTEMFIIPDDITVKGMADLVRLKDKIMLERIEKAEAAEKAIEDAQKILERINQETDEIISYPRETPTDGS